MKEDTIAAVATAVGEGGIGIIRISGEEAKSILEKLFVPIRKKIEDVSKKTEKNNAEDERNKEFFLPTATNTIIGEPICSRRLTYGHIVDQDNNGKIVDEVLAVYMKAPYTYTTEDIVEINCHGSLVSLRKTLELVLKSGARIAEPGEFTKRAFLNGRLDLSQAEAVIDLIKAKTEKSFDLAMDQLSGELSKNIKDIRGAVLDLLVDVTVNIDYPDEDIEEITYEKLMNSLLQIDDTLSKLLSTADAGRIVREGLAVSIIGKPNVGKSSLLNGFLGETRAIVTEIPGTTRDTIEEFINIKNIPVRITDTAGIRETDDIIEKIGIEKSKESFNKADLIILMLDGSNYLTDEDMEIIRVIGDRKVIVLLNKNDLGQQIEKTKVQSLLPKAKILETVISEGIGIEQLEDEIVKVVYDGEIVQKDSMLITNARHKDLLEKSKKAITDAEAITLLKEPLDIIEIDIRCCYDFLGEIIGETVSDDIINEVFARFCLGK